MNIFVAYSSKNHDLAEQVALALSGSGHNVFFDRDSLPPAGDYNVRIRDAILSSDIFIFLISPDSVAKKAYTLTELGFAKHKWAHPKNFVIPVMLEQTSYDDIPNYLKAVTILEPKGSVAAEVKEFIDGVLLSVSKDSGGASEKTGKSSILSKNRTFMWILGITFISVNISTWNYLQTQPDPALSSTQSDPAELEELIRKILVEDKKQGKTQEPDPEVQNAESRPPTPNSVAVVVTLPEDASLWQKLLLLACADSFGSTIPAVDLVQCTGATRGNFDGIGLSLGGIQVNFSSGTLRAFMSSVLSKNPGIVATAFGQNINELLTVLSQSRAKQVAWADSISEGPNKEKLKKEWTDSFLTLANSPLYQKAYVDYFRSVYARLFLTMVEDLNIKTEYGLAVVAMVSIRQGSFLRARNSVLKQLAHYEEVTGEPPDEFTRIRVGALLRAQKASPRWREFLSKKYGVLLNGLSDVGQANYLEKFGFEVRKFDASALQPLNDG